MAACELLRIPQPSSASHFAFLAFLSFGARRKLPRGKRHNLSRRRRNLRPDSRIPSKMFPKPQAGTAPAQPAPAERARANAKPSEVPKTVQPGQPPENIIEAIEFRGARRVRQDTLQALIFTKKGDRFDEQALHRDFMALWNTGRFDDIRIEREPGKEGWIIRFVVVERPVVRSIKYEGNKSVTVSDILDRYKERKVGLVVESQYDPNKIQRAKTC